MGDPIVMVCEGSGCPTHPVLLDYGICKMCGKTVETNLGYALLHTREDIIAMLDRDIPSVI